MLLFCKGKSYCRNSSCSAKTNTVWIACTLCFYDGTMLWQKPFLLPNQVFKLSVGVSCRPVTDYNEIANHFVESIYVHFYNTKSRVLLTLVKFVRQYELLVESSYMVCSILNFDDEYYCLVDRSNRVVPLLLRMYQGDIKLHHQIKWATEQLNLQYMHLDLYTYIKD